MEKILLILLIFNLGFCSSLKSQTLPTPTFFDVPCSGTVGDDGDTMYINFVPGATYYEWTTISGQENSVFFNGNISPVQVTSNQVALYYTMPQNPWEVCVTAFSACCSSAPACTTIYSIDSIMFDPSNSLTALPNTSGTYDINYITCILNSSSILYWSVTGDITFINGQQSQLTPFNYSSAQLNFGPNFTTGTLCVYSVNGIGVPSNTICITISAPVGMQEINNPLFEYSIDIPNENIFVTLPALSKNNQILIYDIVGKLLYQQKSRDNSLNIGIREFNNGVYLISVVSDGKYLSTKIMINR